MPPRAPSPTTRWTPSKATSSRRGGPPARLRAFTVDHFRAWCRLQTLDSGNAWDPQDFQLEIVGELFAGYREVLAVLPTGNAKTTLCGGVALYHCQFTPDAKVPIGAAAKHQAAILYEQAAGFVRRSPAMLKRFKVQDGYRRIVGLNNGSLIVIYAASDDTGDGIIPSLAFVDELHRHKDDHLYATWRDKLTKRDGQLVTISTAGEDDENPLEQLRAAARKLPNVSTRDCHTIARSEGRGFVMHEYALQPGDDFNDLERVKQANPLAQITIDELQIRRDSPSTKRWQWARFTCNVPVKGETTAIQPETWDDLGEAGVEVPEGASRLGWLDLGWKIDCTAMGIVAWVSHERRIVTAVKVLAPTPGNPVDEGDVVRGLLDLQEFHGVEEVVYDPNAGGQQMVQLLEKGTHPLQVERCLSPLSFIEHSQDPAPMALAASRMDEAIRNRWLVHDKDPELRRHALNVVERPVGSGEKFRYDRPDDAKGEKRSRWPNDAFIGLTMGHSVLVAEQDQPEKEPLVAWA